MGFFQPHPFPAWAQGMVPNKIAKVVANISTLVLGECLIVILSVAELASDGRRGRRLIAQSGFRRLVLQPKIEIKGQKPGRTSNVECPQQFIQRNPAPNWS
jgi:hypothetical protein